MTQITRKSVPMRGLILLLAMFLSAGLVLSGCGDDDTATTPAPAPPPPPPPAPEPEPEPEPEPPQAPATPTGLMISETTETSITWTWNAVEGATAYQVQASMDEMFDESDTVLFDLGGVMVPATTDTTYTASGLEPETSVYVRVRAAAGTLEAPVLSDWSTHVTGMSAMPPPEPEPMPDPVTAMFMVPDGAKKSYPMIPDESKDEDKAMASVNPEIMVKASTTAVVVPMNFMTDAPPAPVKLHEGENTPFKYLDWKAPQSTVVNDGATFKIMRVTVGANQEMEPTGDVAYVTCGPFSCADGMDAPTIGIADSATCDGWEATLDIDVGLIDNDQLSHTGTAYQEDSDTTKEGNQTVIAVRVFDGLDLGWIYTSNEDFKAKHDLAVVSHTTGTNDDASNTELPANSVGQINLGTAAGGSNEQSYFAMSAEPDETGRNARTGDGVVNDIGSCQPVAANATAVTFMQNGAHFSIDGAEAGNADPIWAYNDNVSSRVSQPEECFRLTVDEGLDRNYLENYEVVLTLASANLTWGEISWDAFKGHTCDPKTFTPDVDVCSLLTADVDMLPMPKAKPVVTQPDAHTNLNTTAANSDATSDTAFDQTLAGFNLLFEKADDNRHRFTAMRYLDTSDTKGKRNLNLYADGDASAETGRDSTNYVAVDAARKDARLLYADATTPATADQNNAGGEIPEAAGTSANVWVPTIDRDFDPIYDDLGKASIDGNDTADNFVKTDDSYKCTADDGGDKATGKDGANKNSTLCDAKVDIPTSVTFVDGMGLGCKETVDYTLECTWSSRGNVNNSVGGNATEFTAATASKFVSCKVTKD